MTPDLGPMPAPSVQPPLLVMKFGGTSLANATCLRRVSSIVRRHLEQQPIVVLSAMGKTTNELLAAAESALETGTVDISKIKEPTLNVLKDLGLPVPVKVSELFEELTRIISGVALLKEVSCRTRDLVVSFGERLSVRVFEALFNSEAGDSTAGDKEKKPVGATALDSWEVGFRTSSGSGSASSAFSQSEVLTSTYSDVALYMDVVRREYKSVPVITGYIAKDDRGTITTLGRDGSDLTATVIGAAVGASEVQIWKDVDGILTTDPRLCPSARPVCLLTYEEAAELTAFGSKVVHPAAVMPAWKARVPMSVRNSMSPESPGTRIVFELDPIDRRDGRVAAISCKRDITMIVIQSTRMLGQHGFLAHVFQVFNKFEASIDVIATSEVTVSLTLDQGFKDIDLAGLTAEVETVANVEVMENMSMLTLITARSDSCAVLRETFDAFESLNVVPEMVSHGASKVNVTFVLRDSVLSECTRKLHEVFFER